MSNDSYKGKNVAAYECNDVIALDGDILVTDMDFGLQTTNSGIIIGSDDGKIRGIHPRWAKVYKVGSGVNEVVPGDWVFVEHGRWTRPVNVSVNGLDIEFRKIERKSILLVTNEKPGDILIGEEFDMSSSIKPEDFQN